MYTYIYILPIIENVEQLLHKWTHQSQYYIESQKLCSIVIYQINGYKRKKKSDNIKLYTLKACSYFVYIYITYILIMFC